MLRFLREHPTRVPPVESEKEADRRRQLEMLDSLPPEQLGDLYQAHAQMLEGKPLQLPPRSASGGATPSTAESGKSD